MLDSFKQTGRGHHQWGDFRIYPAAGRGSAHGAAAARAIVGDGEEARHPVFFVTARLNPDATVEMRSGDTVVVDVGLGCSSFTNVQRMTHRDWHESAFGAGLLPKRNGPAGVTLVGGRIGLAVSHASNFIRHDRPAAFAGDRRRRGRGPGSA